MTTLAKVIAEKVREHAEKFSDEHNMTMHYTRPAMTALAEEVVKLSLAAHSAKLQRLLSDAETRIHESGSREHVRLCANDGCACNSCFKERLRAALADMKEVENG